MPMALATLAWIITPVLQTCCKSYRMVKRILCILPYVISRVVCYTPRAVTITLPLPGKLVRLYRPLLAATRKIIARIYIYTLKRLRFRPQTPSSRTISALNSANVGCFSLTMLNRVSVCKRNDVAFAGKFVLLILPANPDPAWSTR